MYEVTFQDDSSFTGGEPNDSMWDCLTNKVIKALVYWLNDDLKWSFSNFEQYNHTVERVRGVNANFEVISKVIIMGKVKDRVYQVVYDLKRNKVHQIVVPYDKEYSNQEALDEYGNFKGWINGAPISGWKQGILNPEYPGAKLKKIIL